MESGRSGQTGGEGVWPLRSRLFGTPAACLLCLVAGCSAGRARLQPSATSGGAPPPAALQTLAADASALLTSAAARNWTNVDAELAGVEQAWSLLRPSAAAASARTGLLDAIDGAITALVGQADAHAVRGTQTAANRVTSYVPDLLALYASPVPPQISEMQFLAREVQLDAGRHPAAVWDDARTLETQWAYIRPAAIRVDGGDAAALDGELADLDAAVSRLAPASQAAATFAAPGAAAAGMTSGTSGRGAAPASSSLAGSSASSASAPSSSSSSAPAAPAHHHRDSTGAPHRPHANGAAPAPAPGASAVGQAAAQILGTLGALQSAFQAAP